MNRAEQRTRDLLELNDLLKRLSSVDMERLEIEREEAKTVRERLVEKLEADKKLGFKLAKPEKKRKPGRPKKHWRQRRATYRKRYFNTLKPQRRAKRIDQLKQGWYWYLTDSWYNHGKECLITPEEWHEVVEPCLGPKAVPSVRRYNTSEPITLDNIYIRDKATKELLYDGKEHFLRKQGFIL